jgi:hypothetical protein
MMETFGKHKRDLLRDALEDASRENEKATEQFKDALTQLKELTGSTAAISRRNTTPSREYEGCLDRSKPSKAASEKSIAWPRISSPSGNANSRKSRTPNSAPAARSKLTETRGRYQQVHAALVRSEATLEPVLLQMKDYVLYLKHNLNARAVGSIKDEAVLEIENENRQAHRRGRR